MTKRTKRYGGFLIGDRVYPKNKKDWRLDEGKVVLLQDGYVIAQFYDCGFTNPTIAFMPNQLINLTRIEGKQQEYLDKINSKINELFPCAENERVIKAFEDLCNSYGDPTPFENLTTGTLEEREKKFKNMQEEYIEQYRLKPIKDFVDEALRQTELFLSPLSPFGNPIPSPYTRDFQP